MSFDAVNRKILMKSINMSCVGSYQIEISLTDKAKDTSIYNLVFIIKADNVVTGNTKKKDPSTSSKEGFKGVVIPKETQKLPSEVEKDQFKTPVRVMLEDVSRNGVITLYFNQRLVVPKRI